MRKMHSCNISLDFHHSRWVSHSRPKGGAPIRTNSIQKSNDISGGEAGIRTLETLLGSTHFPGALLRPTRTPLRYPHSNAAGTGLTNICPPQSISTRICFILQCPAIRASSLIPISPKTACARSCCFITLPPGQLEREAFLRCIEVKAAMKHRRWKENIRCYRKPSSSF